MQKGSNVSVSKKSEVTQILLLWQSDYFHVVEYPGSSRNEKMEKHPVLLVILCLSLTEKLYQRLFQEPILLQGKHISK